MTDGRWVWGGGILTSTAAAVARELDRTRVERDAYRDALEQVTHDFTPRRPGSDVCGVCGWFDGPEHQTPGRVAAALAVGTPGAVS